MDVSGHIPHPVRCGAQLFFLPDAAHVFKAIKSMLEKNKIIKIPKDIMEEKLVSDIIAYKHIEHLYYFESKFELKVAFCLKKDNVYTNKQFAKMNVSNSRAVLCNRTSVELKRLVSVTENHDLRTTAWFVEIINAFFELITAKHHGLALSRFNETAYSKALNIIQKVNHLFLNMEIGDTGSWKSCQRGIGVLRSSFGSPRLSFK